MRDTKNMAETENVYGAIEIYSKTCKILKLHIIQMIHSIIRN